jgi:prepilin peptidase CpaA
LRRGVGLIIIVRDTAEAWQMLELVVLLLFPLLMAYSAASDLLTMTIANWISLVLVGAFIVVALIAGMPVAELLTNHLACGLAVLVLTFTLFAFGWIGGGDAKLAAATAVWLGWQKIFEYSFEASAIGGALTLAILIWRRYEMPPVLMRRAWIARLHSATNGVPYGIALAVTGLVLYPETWVWTSVASS